ncbi:MAG: carboxypeptidase regulatory-like domain-containing protein, partial [Deinococcales bacterium]|nr:carboxypeptidase regulatory-like domain-containing protein [Chitinophagaceae bacterium]
MGIRTFITKKISLLFIIIASLSSVSSQAQITTSGIRGKVISPNKNGLAAAAITAILETTNEKYITTSQSNGSFNLPNIKSGGPYTVICSYTGFKADTVANIYLSLGNFYYLDFELQSTITNLKEVTVVGRNNSTINRKRTGISTNISKDQLAQLPTISRSLQDFTRLSPQANGNSFAGSNYRYNNLSIDGAALNDAFGFTEPASGAGGSQATGTPGSLAKTQPISLESVQEVQVAVSPFNVTSGNFTGGSINAVTRSGTNTFQGSVFFSGRNQTLTGKSPDDTRTSIEDFHDYQTGFRIGGAIKKNTLFYFASAEIGRRKEPVLFAPGSDNAVIPYAVA